MMIVIYVQVVIVGILKIAIKIVLEYVLVTLMKMNAVHVIMILQMIVY